MIVLSAMMSIALAADAQQDTQQGERLQVKPEGYGTIPASDVLEKQIQRQVETNEDRNKRADALADLLNAKSSQKSQTQKNVSKKQVKSSDEVKLGQLLNIKFHGYEVVPVIDILERKARLKTETNDYRNRVAKYWSKILRYDLSGQTLGGYCIPRNTEDCPTRIGTAYTEQPDAGRPPFSDFNGLFRVLGVIEAGPNYGDPRDTKDTYRVFFYNKSLGKTNLTMALKGNPASVTVKVQCPLKYDGAGGVLYSKGSVTFDFKGSNNSSFLDGLSRTLSFCPAKIIPLPLNAKFTPDLQPSVAEYIVTMNVVPDKSFAGWGHRWYN